MLCISDGAYIESADRRRSSRETWIKSGKQMAELFADLPEALANTLVISQRCATLAPYRNPILPSLAGDRTAEDAQLREDARIGLEKRLEISGITDPAEQQIYFDRLKFEADVICAMGFPGYFLIVADFIKWAKEQDIAVGPGRGSGRGWYPARCAAPGATAPRPAP